MFPVVFQRGGRGASWLLPGWNSVAYFKPLAQGVSSSSSDFFRTLFVQMLCGESGREGEQEGGGGESSSRLALPPAAHLRQRWSRLRQPGCCVQRPPAGAPPRGSPNPTGSVHAEKLQERRTEHQSQHPAFKGQQIPVQGPSSGSRKHPEGGRLRYAPGLMPSSHTYGKTHGGARIKSQPDPAAKHQQGSETPRKKGLETPPAAMVVPAPSRPPCPQPSC